jgi:inner membrane protein
VFFPAPSDNTVVDWWIWLVIGLGLLAMEVLTPSGFYQFFFGLGALATGALAWAGLGGPLWLEGLIFATLSVVAVVLFREKLDSRFHRTTREFDTIESETAVAMALIAPGGSGQVELRGSVWQARNVGDREIAPGQRCTVARVDGLTLQVISEL